MPNWPSVQATAHVLKVAIETKSVLEVELKNGSTRQCSTRWDAGSIHVHPEAWLPNLDHLKRQYVDGKKSIKMNPNSATGTQAMCVTKATADRTGIVELKELRNPEMAKIFDSDGDGKGEVWVGADGWGSTPIERVRARSYGYDATMTLKIMEETAALDELDSAVKQDKNIVFFCYTPHHMFALYDLVVLKEPAYDANKWVIVPPSPTPGWLEKSKRRCCLGYGNTPCQLCCIFGGRSAQGSGDVGQSVTEHRAADCDDLCTGRRKAEPSAFAAKWIEDTKTTVDLSAPVATRAAVLILLRRRR